MADVLSYKRAGRMANAKPLDEPPVEHQTEMAIPGSAGGHKMDAPKAREVHKKLLSWFYYERDRQALNRLEMAMDHDFYDGDQWSDDDKAVLEDRGQSPLVYNEVAPMADWMIGTERRARVDWKILPRAEDDVEMADIKTKAMKYVADVNNTAFQRSRAFADAVKGGIGFVDDGVRDDPTQDAIYSRYEDWRCVLMDSSGLDLTGDDARYIFRWRWVDEDIAIAMFPDRADKIRQSVEDWALGDNMDDEELSSWQSPLDGSGNGGTISPLSASSSSVDAKRRRIKLIECQWREPVATKFVTSGPMAGSVFDERDSSMAYALNEQAQSGNAPTFVDKISMRVHVAVMTESFMLRHGPSIYRHNKFSLTPVVCYRKGRDRMWYGAIRRVRSIQQDLNKRASKALWYLNANQLLAEEGAFEDIEHAREEAQDPNGVIIYKAGRQAAFKRDTDAATGQIQIMSLDQQAIQRSAGVTDENLGRKTNAVSGEAIKARQIQGSVVTTEPYDNARMAAQAQGQKQLSLIEQFYSEKKVLRLTGAQGQIEWVKLNEPEAQADGSIRYLNDVTASIADYVVSEADYAGTLRQVMFDSLMQLSQRLPPEIALRMLRMAFQYSDLPNKNEIADEIRRLTGDKDPAKEMSPEEQAQAQAQAQAQQEAMQLQRQQAQLALEEQAAKVREINARADKLIAEAQSAGAMDQTGMQSRIENAAGMVRQQAAQEIDTLTQRLAKATASNEAALAKVRADADSAANVARIEAASRERIAELQRPADEALKRIESRLAELESMQRETSPKGKA